MRSFILTFSLQITATQRGTNGLPSVNFFNFRLIVPDYF